MTKWIILHH